MALVAPVMGPGAITDSRWGLAASPALRALWTGCSLVVLHRDTVAVTRGQTRSHWATGATEKIWAPNPGHCGWAGSSGGRDEFDESFGCSIPSVELAWATVDDRADVVELVLAVAGQVGAFGEEPADLAVPVLVAGTLPGAMWIAEVDRDAGGDREALVGSEFAALVPGQRAGQQRGQPGHRLADAFADMLGGFVLELDDHPEPGGPLDEGGGLAGVAGTDDQIAFPMARHGAIGGLGGALGDVDHPHDLAAASLAAGARLAAATPRLQTRGELFAQLTPALHKDRLIDRLVRHPPL